MTEPEPPKTDSALGLGANFTANKVQRTAELAGTVLRIGLRDGRNLAFEFTDAENLQVSDGAQASRTSEVYEAQKVAQGLFLIAYQHAADAMASTSLIADMVSGEIVHIRNVVGERIGDEPAVAQTVTLGQIEGHASNGPGIAVTNDLFGRRAMWVYSEDDVYEHIYLNADWYAWHCLKGEEYPKADIDPCQTFKLRENIYLLTFSEKVMSMAAGMVLDFANLRSYCAALGRDPGSNALTHFTFGAHGTILSQTDYPKPLVAAQ